MNNDEWTGILIILGIIFIIIFGGTKGASVNGLFSNRNQTPVQKQVSIQNQIYHAQNEVEDLKSKIAEGEAKKTDSTYKGMVKLAYVNRSPDVSQEYIAIQVMSNATNIPITGWILKSLNTQNSVSIPKGTYLFQSGKINEENNIILKPYDILYVITGISPNGTNFETNKCSGYLEQYQDYVPYLYSSCPLPRDEDLSSISKSGLNDACLDYINSLPSCTVPTKLLPSDWSYQCTDFIQKKINYPACVDAHRNDTDFYKNEWRVYLKRSQSLWKNEREIIVLYDNLGKVVDTLKY